MHTSWSTTHQAELDYRRDRIRTGTGAGTGTREPRRRLRRRTTRPPGGEV